MPSGLTKEEVERIVSEATNAMCFVVWQGGTQEIPCVHRQKRGTAGEASRALHPGMDCRSEEELKKALKNWKTWS